MNDKEIELRCCELNDMAAKFQFGELKAKLNLEKLFS